jgi:hypothetical protein
MDRISDMKVTTFIGLAIHPQLASPPSYDKVPPYATVPLDNNTVLHVPVNRFDFSTKADFIAEVTRQATRIYDTMSKTFGET